MMMKDIVFIIEEPEKRSELHLAPASCTHVFSSYDKHPRKERTDSAMSTESWVSEGPEVSAYTPIWSKALNVIWYQIDAEGIRTFLPHGYRLQRTREFGICMCPILLLANVLLNRIMKDTDGTISHGSIVTYPREPEDQDYVENIVLSSKTPAEVETTEYVVEYRAFAVSCQILYLFRPLIYVRRIPILTLLRH